MTEAVARQPDAGRQTPSAGRQVWNFIRHFLETCVAMCVRGNALIALVFVAGPALLGYPDLMSVRGGHSARSSSRCAERSGRGGGSRAAGRCARRC